MSRINAQTMRPALGRATVHPCLPSRGKMSAKPAEEERRGVTSCSLSRHSDRGAQLSLLSSRPRRVEAPWQTARCACRLARCACRSSSQKSRFAAIFGSPKSAQSKDSENKNHPCHLDRARPFLLSSRPSKASGGILYKTVTRSEHGKKPAADAHFLSKRKFIIRTYRWTISARSTRTASS